MARPPFPWTEEIEKRICDELSSGGSIHAISKQDWAPHATTIYGYMAANEAFAARIAKARASQQEHEVDAMVEMADAATPETWQVVKLQIWARQWRAAKLAPKKYGERIAQEISGPDGGPVEIDDTQAASRLAALITLAQQRKDDDCDLVE